jgi:hypothetical protein
MKTKVKNNTISVYRANGKKEVIKFNGKLTLDKCKRILNAETFEVINFGKKVRIILDGYGNDKQLRVNGHVSLMVSVLMNADCIVRGDAILCGYSLLEYDEVNYKIDRNVKPLIFGELSLRNMIMIPTSDCKQ